MNKYKSIFSVAEIISESLESNEWQREMEDIGESDTEDEMHEKKVINVFISIYRKYCNK